MSSFENFVQCRIVTPLTASAADVALYAAVAPYRLPPEAGGVLVLTDSPGNPSVVEVVRYSHRTGLALYGLQRGQEGTTARDWTGPVFCYQALMAGDFQSILDELNAGIDSKVDKAAGQSLMTDAERTKLSGIAAGAQVNAVTSVAGRTGAVTLAKADVGLSNVDNTSDANKPVSTAQQAAFNLKANLASPTFTGAPKAPTPAASDNSTLLATTAFVKAVVGALVNGAPGTLDQLNELAAALGNDPNFATTMLNALASKAPLASPALTGNPTAPTAAADDNDTSIATTAFVRAAMALFGLGSSSAPVLQDFNAPPTETGVYQVTTETLNAPAGIPAGSSCLNIRIYGGSHGFQLAVSRDQDVIKLRRRNSNTLPAWQEIWHTGNLVKQTSSTDTTAGALMAVGAFGQGAAPIISDANAAPLGLSIANLATALNVPEGLSGAGFIETREGRALTSRSVQELYSSVQERKFIRTYTGSVWGAWRELFHTGNILGTVSQFNGVPTGAIIERGSNANGEYVKYADGTLECTRRSDEAVSATAQGNIYSGVLAPWTFPAAFAELQYLHFVPRAVGVWGGVNNANLTNTSGEGRIFSTSALSGVAVSILRVAKGRWF